MVGLIDVGGGLRDSYGAGVLDRCIDDGIEFPYCIGVSAGSGNVATYLAKQRGRTLRFYTEYIFHKEYMSVGNFFKTGSYLGLDYLYSTLSNEGGIDPLDFDAVQKSGAKFLVGSTDAETGKPVYFDFSDCSKNNYTHLKASCALPIACKAYVIDGKEYFDGGISDPIPFDKAFEDGCDRVAVILTRPKDDRKIKRVPGWVYNAVMRKYPNSSPLMDSCVDKYNDDVERLLQLEKEGKALILAPESIKGVRTLTKNVAAIESFYHEGYKAAEKIKEFLSKDTDGK